MNLKCFETAELFVGILFGFAGVGFALKMDFYF